MKFLLLLALCFSLAYTAVMFQRASYPQRYYLEVGQCFTDIDNTRYIITHRLQHGFRYDYKDYKCLNSGYSPYDKYELSEIDCLPENTQLKHCD